MLCLLTRTAIISWGKNRTCLASYNLQSLALLESAPMCSSECIKQVFEVIPACTSSRCPQFFPNIYEPPQNSRHRKSGTKKVPYRGPANIRHHHIKLTVQELCTQNLCNGLVSSISQPNPAMCPLHVWH